VRALDLLRRRAHARTSGGRRAGRSGDAGRLRAARCIIAVEDDKPQAIAALEAALATAADARLELRSLPAVFPLGAEGPLVAALTGREVPIDGLPPQVGVVCQNVATAASVARLVRDGMPVVSRVVTVTGSGVLDPRTWRLGWAHRLQNSSPPAGATLDPNGASSPAAASRAARSPTMRSR